MKVSFSKCFIDTNRLNIKPLALEDLNDFTALLMNKEISKTFIVPNFNSSEEARKLAEKLIKNERGSLEVGIYLNSKLIGFINDCGFDDEGIEIGYVINPNYKGQGYATEAVKGIIDYLFQIGFKKICAAYFIENIASKRVMEKSGMIDINVHEEIEYRGVKHQCNYYGIRRE